MAGFAGFPPLAIDFFKGLERNNTREWFEVHKDTYEQACRGPMKALLTELEPLHGASRMSRINRDMRFVRQGGPYKTHLSAGIGGAYLSLSNHGLYVGAGMYKPEPPTLQRFRASIDDDRTGAELAGIVSSLRRLRYEVGTHESLTSAPKGYPADHARIELLRMKDIFAGKTLEPGPWLSTRKAFDRVTKVMTDMEPLIKWLRRHVGKRA